jgi:hypothetical protein
MFYAKDKPASELAKSEWMKIAEDKELKFDMELSLKKD